MTASPSPARRAAIVYNPTKNGMAALRRVVTAAARHAGWEPTLWIETTADDPGTGQAREAVAAGVDVVLAAGGDGTVRAVAEGLRESGVPLALVPAGTGNLLARNLPVPLGDLESAVALAFDGENQAIDVGVATMVPPEGDEREHAFLVMAGLGIDAEMIANARPGLKKRVGWLAYVDSGVRALPRASKVRIRYSLDDGPEHSAQVSTILVGNCGSLPGGIELLPDAAVDDGMLDVAVLQPKTIFGWLPIWRRVTWENRVLRRTRLGRSFIRLTGSEEMSQISYLRGASVRVAVDEPQPVELDGDEFGEVVELRLRVDPRSLLVRVPRK